MFHVQIAHTVENPCLFFYVPNGISRSPIVQMYDSSREGNFAQSDRKYKRKTVQSRKEKASGVVVTPLVAREEVWQTTLYPVPLDRLCYTEHGTYYGPFSKTDELLLSPRFESGMEPRRETVMSFVMPRDWDAFRFPSYHVVWAMSRVLDDAEENKDSDEDELL